MASGERISLNALRRVEEKFSQLFQKVILDVKSSFQEATVILFLFWLLAPLGTQCTCCYEECAETLLCRFTFCPLVGITGTFISSEMGQIQGCGSHQQVAV